MTYTITKSFEFSAAHRLSHLPETHQCFRLHGHNYILEIELQSDTLDQYGFVRDYGELSVVKAMLDEQFEHRFLNDQLPVPPTAENMAHYFFHRIKPAFPKLSAVRIKETPKTCAEYRP